MNNWIFRPRRRPRARPRKRRQPNIAQIATLEPLNPEL